MKPTMFLKLATVLILAVIPGLFTSCSGAGVFGESDSSSDSSYTYDFKDQELQGKIQDASWYLLSGKAGISTFDNNDFEISLYNEDPSAENICDDAMSDIYPQVFFTISQGKGITELGWDGMQNSSVTIVTAPGENTIISTGAVEIISTNDGTVSGRMDIYSSETTWLNGDFSVPFCQAD